MEMMNIKSDIKAFGIHVKDFPGGVDKAFKELIEKTGDAAGKINYYGVSFMKDGKMIYYALAEEKQNNESAKYNYEAFTIEAGEYATEELKDWQNKTGCIKDIFTEMIQDENIDKQKPAIEWYKNGAEMLCMLKTK